MTEISYPVLYLGKRKPVIENGAILFISVTSEDGIDTTTIQVVDDKRIPGSTLGKRRAWMLSRGINLFPIKTAIFFLGDLIKLAEKGTWFIDDNGKLFTYTKTKHVKLVFRKITKLIPINTGGCIVEVEGIKNRFKSLFMPNIEDKYAGVLKDGFSYILYGFFNKEYSSTRRMI